MFTEGDNTLQGQHIILKIIRKPNPIVVAFYKSFKIIRTLEYAYLDQCFLVYSPANVV